MTDIEAPGRKRDSSVERKALICKSTACKDFWITLAILSVLAMLSTGIFFFCIRFDCKSCY